MIRGLAMMLACVACAQGAEIDPQLAGPFVLHADAPEPAPCGMAFDPAPTLVEATQRAAERWRARRRFLRAWACLRLRFTDGFS